MTDTKMTKSAGEYWVCSALARRGWGAALTRDGLERTDILAVKADESRQQVEIQVKAATGDGPKTSWPITEKSQSPARSPREWFVFVALGADPKIAPRSFVIPRDHVGVAAHIVHYAWLREPGIPEGKRNVGVDRARVSIPDWVGYEDRWDLLDHPADEAPILLRPQLRALAERADIGFPLAHPWRDSRPQW